VGAFLALWVIGYGLIQALVPEILRSVAGKETVSGSSARLWAFLLLAVPLGLLGAIRFGAHVVTALVIGLAVFAVVFAVNSAIHSYLVLAYTEDDGIALNVGFYYMANAAGRLLGTLLSGIVFQLAGFAGCLWGAFVLILITALLSMGLPETAGARITMAEAAGE
jgi:predicted MFS family arabinose efflux permease